ncbi:MAG: sorbosone dehydrogenase family protein [Hyphomicrobiaceae bacterium]
MKGIFFGLSILAVIAATAGAVTLAAAVVAPLEIGEDEVFGPSPKLAEPRTAWVPTIQIPKPVGWGEDELPVVAQGLRVVEFAGGLDHPRWLYVLPDGSVLVAETNRPPKEAGGLKSWVMSFFMGKAGAGVASPNRITRLVDSDGDGKADKRSVLLDNLMSPFGMALVGDTLYVANADAVVRFPHKAGAERIAEPAEIVTPLPGGPRNHHWTKNIIASRDGSRLYAAIGSNSNVGENGLAEEEGRAAIWEIKLADGKARSFATGLRNPVGMDFKTGTDELWTVVNERDELGDNLVPDYLTHVKDGAFYGWPQKYYATHLDDRAPNPKSGEVPEAEMPDYALGAHTASLGLAFSDGKTLGAAYVSGAFIGQHGSWNRTVPTGYRVIFVPFVDGKPSGAPSVVLGGFLNEKGQARGRPVGVTLDGKGGLLVADDVGNKIWHVSADAAAR